MRTILTILASVVVTLAVSRTADVWAEGYYVTGQDDIQSIAYDVLWPIPDLAARAIVHVYEHTGHDTSANDALCRIEPWHTAIKLTQLGFDPDC